MNSNTFLILMKDYSRTDPDNWRHKVIRIALKFVLVCHIMAILPGQVSGSWEGPRTVLIGTLGTNSAEFGLDTEENWDGFPTLTAVLSHGQMVIDDRVNRRILVYDATGILVKTVPWEIESDGRTSPNPEFPIYQYWNIQGFTNTGDIWMKFERYVLKSQDGVIKRGENTMPPELGVITEKYLSPGRYLITVAYPDRTWAIVGRGAVPYMRAMSGDLYAVGDTQTVRYDYCGRELSRLTMPEGKSIEFPPAEPGAESTVIGLEGYGSPVLAPNGDVYTWKLTPDTYSIIKWTWQDDPDTPPPTPDGPTELKASSSATGLTLTWRPSFQDPGCVTEYEILRSDTPGGPYGRIGLVAKGVLKYEDTTAQPAVTYYYTVRALSGTAYSGYSNEVMGKR